MARRLLLVSFLAIFSWVIALSDVNKQCIDDNYEIWSNDNLIGTWYMIYLFKRFGLGRLGPSWSCTELTFTRPSAAVVQEYKKRYNDPKLPYNITDNPVQVSNGKNLNGLVIGHSIAKFFVLTPNTTMTLGLETYTVNAYRQLAPKYIMFTQCKLRGHERWLLSSDRHAPVAEMQELISNTPELHDLHDQRFCATY